MKTLKLTALLITMALASAVYSADSPADDLKAAAKKLAEKGNYSWKTTSDTPAGGGGGGRQGAGRMGGPTDGKTDKGITHLVMTRGDNSFEALIKSGKVAIKGQDGWQAADTAPAGDAAAGDRGNPGRFMGRMFQSYKTPAEEVQDLAGKATDLKKEGDAYVGTLGADAVRDIFTRGRQNAQGPSDAKGSVKFWVKDGALSKYEVNLQGKTSFQGNEREFNRTTTTEIKDVGTTKLTVPEDATKLVS